MRETIVETQIEATLIFGGGLFLLLGGTAMSIQDDYLFVRFDKYCKTCKHEKLEENEPPCDECLEHPVNLHSHKPVCYEGTDE